MKRLGLVGLTVLGACVLSDPASAQSLAPASAPRAGLAALGGPGGDAGDGQWSAGTWSDGQRYDVRRYWRRREPRYADRGIVGWFDVRGGFYDTQDVSKNDWTIGFKATGKVTPEVSLGMSTDLHRRTDSDRVIESQYTDPTGHVVTTSSTAFDAESNLVPVMGVVEVHVPAKGLDPYFGAAGGWEFLNVQVRDYVSGFEGEANYDGPGYQLFGGAGVPLGDRARLTGEAYWNGSTVQRHVIDPSTGYEVEERIGVDGGGARVGLSFAF